MLLNENRGSFGMFSRAGRNAAEKFHILVKKDEILAGNQKRIKLKDFFAPDDQKKTEDNEDKLDIFKTENDEKETNKSDPHILSKLKKKSREQEMKKLNQIRKKNKKKLPDPTCTKYNPKNEFIWRRTLTGPTWDASIKKNFSIKQKDEVNPKFYLSHSDFKIDGRNFIDLARQTNRKYITGEIMRHSKSSNNVKRNTKYTGVSDDLEISRNNFLEEENNRAINNYTEDSRDKSICSNSKMKTAKKFYKANRPETPKSKSINHAQDFRKLISREQIENLHGDKRTIIPFSFPNFKWTTSRPIMMVKYNKKLHRVRKEKFLEGPKSTEINFDPDKVLEKINNHRTVKTPNFDMMLSRPKDDGPLPSFMKNIYSRQSTGIISEKTLKMNNHSDAKFSTVSSSFWPKKTYNRVVEMNLLNSARFKESAGLNQKNNNLDGTGEVNEYVEKSMKFYNKNYDDILKESMLSKFDNVTFKTIKRKNKFESEEIQKLLINFEKSNS